MEIQQCVGYWNFKSTPLFPNAWESSGLKRIKKKSYLLCWGTLEMSRLTLAVSFPHQTPDSVCLWWQPAKSTWTMLEAWLFFFCGVTVMSCVHLTLIRVGWIEQYKVKDLIHTVAFYIKEWGWAPGGVYFVAGVYVFNFKTLCSLWVSVRWVTYLCNLAIFKRN